MTGAGLCNSLKSGKKVEGNTRTALRLAEGMQGGGGGWVG